MEMKLGDTVKHKDEPFRVIRIVEKSRTLFETDEGESYVVEESYVELKGGTGDIEFITLYRTRLSYEGAESLIKGQGPVLWREE